MRRFGYILFFAVLLFTTQDLSFYVKAGTNEIPVIQLIGNDSIYLELGTSYIEYGAKATDLEDGDLSSNIIINSSSLNVNAVGTYSITYSVTDSNANTVTTTRKIIVYNGNEIQQQKDFNYYSSSYNDIYFSDVLSTSDDGFIAIGRYGSASSNTYANIMKFDSTGQKVWEIDHSFYSSYRYNYITKVIKTQNNNYIAIGYNSYYGYSGIITFTEAGQVISSSYTSASFYTDIVEYDSNRYAVVGGSYVYLYEGTNYSKTIYLGNISKIEATGDGNLVYYYQSGYDTIVKKINLMGGLLWSKTITNTSLIDLFFKDNQIILVGNTTNTTNSSYDLSHGGKDGTIIKLGIDGSILSSKTYGGLLDDTFNLVNLVNDKLVLTSSSASTDGNLSYGNNGIAKINLTTYDVNFKTHYNQVLSVKSLTESMTGNVILVGGYYNSNNGYYYQKYSIIDTTLILNGIEDKTITINDPYDVTNDFTFINKNGEHLNYSIMSTEGTFDNTVVGYYDLIYNVSILDNDQYYTLRLTRRITVEPKITGITDGATYDGSLKLDVLGGIISVEGTTYNRNDVYTTPGLNHMTITGANGYVKTMDFTINLVASGIDDGQNYAKPVSLTYSGGDATLDGNPYNSGDLVSSIGNHEIIITGANGFNKTIQFTILPVISGVRNNATYDKTITPIINASDMTLNGEIYQNEPIENAGNYTLVINGVGGYTQTIQFVIETTITGVSDGGVYEERVTPLITKGTIYLNDQIIQSGNEVTTPGLNTLKVTGANGYEKIITFTVNLSIKDIEANGIYAGSVTPLISGGTITLNGEPFVSGTEITSPGNYTIQILGAPNFLKKFSFIVTPLEVNVSDGMTYDIPVIPTISGGTLLLNGAPYESGTVVKNSGNYVLEIIGEGGYYSKYNFTITPGTNIINNQDYVNSVVITFVGDATLNGEPITSGTTLQEIGNYDLVITDGAFNQTVQFRVVPDLSDFNTNLLLSYTINIPTGTLTLDGTVITTNYTVNDIGNHTLIIDGVNGYQETVNFIIQPDVNIINGQDYTTSVLVDAKGGMITLDGADYTALTDINEMGTHTLVITGVNGYVNEIIFYVIPVINNIENNGVYEGTVTPSIQTANLLLDGASFISGTEITQLGHHIITITGVNSFTRDIEFYIIPAHLSVIENGVYEGEVIVQLDTMDLLLNGAPYTSGTTINKVGLNTLTLIDGNGFTHDIHFYITPFINNLAQDGVYVGSVTPVIDWSPLILDGQVYESGTPITIVGYHTLILMNLDGYDYVMHFTVTEELIDFEDQGVYTGSVTPIINNTSSLLLNGETYISGTVIDTVGHHTLTITGLNGYTSIVEFTVEPTIVGVEDQGIYTSSVLPTINHIERLLLNGLSYTSNTAITNVGHYTLTIYGINNYAKTIHFTILPTINDISDGGTYQGSITPNIPNATLYLDGNSYTNLTTINEVGNHTIEITGLNDFSSTITFTVTEVLIDLVDQATYHGSVTPIIENVQTIDLNGNDYTSGTLINTVGNNVLTIYGTNGYVSTITFTITPVIDYVVQDGLYSGGVTPVIQHASLLLDGNDYLSGTEINEVGNHELTINGINDYSEVITFTVEEVISDIVDGTTYNYSVTPNIPNATLLLDGQPYTNQTEIVLVGSHTLTINGVGSYSKSISFTVTEQISGIEDLQTYLGSVTPNIPNASLLLDGEEYISGTAIVSVGNHELTIIGSNLYQKSITFTVLEDAINLVNNGVYDYFVTPEIPNASLTLDGVDYQSGDKIVSVGNHTLEVIGLGGYTNEYYFTVKEKLLGFTNNGVYKTEVLPNIEYAESFKLNNEDYLYGTPINAIGNYNLVVYGTNGYTSEYHFTIQSDLENVEKDAHYTSSVTPIIHSGYTEALLNGNPFTNGSTLTEIGNYTLEIKNGIYSEVYAFTIDPNVVNLNDNSQYLGSVTPLINSDNILLDGNPYLSNTPITEVGNHTIIVNGINNYSKTYSFTVKEITSIEQDGSYEGSVTLTIENVSATLNGENFISGTDITQMGNYRLDVTGCNGYTNTYNFTVNPKIENIMENGTYEEMVTPNITGVGTVLLNGEPYVKQTAITTVGINYFTFEGVNGYTLQVPFTILPKVSGVKQNGEYQNSTSITIDHILNAELNGQAYVMGSQIDEVGNYTLKIYGINGYTQLIDFVIKEDITGIGNGNEYEQPVKIDVLNVSNVSKVMLNGETYVSGTEITKAGIYNLDVYGINDYKNTITFTIKGQTNILDEGQYSSVIPTSSNGQILMDGKLYATLNPFKQVGNHVLTIKGLNGYARDINFTIIPELNGFKDGTEYTSSTQIKIENCTLKLDDQEVKNSLIVSTVGYHTLTVVGTGGYEQTLFFTIHPYLENINEDQEYKNITFNINASLKIDGNTYDNESLYKTVGYHTLSIMGTNGYIDTIHFTIVEDDIKVLNDGVYANSVTPLLNNCKAKLDGVYIENNKPITEIGLHKLTIIGSNGYSKEIEFTIALSSDLVNGKVYEQPVIIKKVNATMYLDGIEITKDTKVSDQGDHTLEIHGTNGYIQTIKFTYHNTNVEKAIIIAIPSVIISGITVVFFISRKRVI